MHPLAHLAMIAALLTVALAAALHPGADVLVNNPLACAGVALIGLGLIRQHRSTATE